MIAVSASVAAALEALSAELAVLAALAPGLFATFSSGPWALPVYICSGTVLFWKSLGALISPITRQWLTRGPTFGCLRLIKTRHTRLTDKALEAVNKALSSSLPLRVAAFRAEKLSVHIGAISGVRVKACGVRVELQWTDQTVWETAKEAIATAEKNRPRGEAQAVISTVQKGMNPKGTNGVKARIVEYLASKAKLSVEGMEVFIAAPGPGDPALLLTATARADTCRCRAIEMRGTKLQASLKFSCAIGTHDMLDSTTVTLGAELPRIMRTLLVPKPLPNKRANITMTLDHAKLALRPSVARSLSGFGSVFERFSAWKAGVVARTQQGIVPTGPGERENYLAGLAAGEDVSELEARMTRRDILLVYREWQDWPVPEGMTIEDWCVDLQAAQKPIRAITAAVCLKSVSAEVMRESDTTGQGLAVRITDTRASVKLHDMALEAEALAKEREKALEAKQAANVKTVTEGSFRERLSLVAEAEKSDSDEADPTPEASPAAPLLDAEFVAGAIEVHCEPGDVFAVPVLEPCSVSASVRVLKSASKDVTQLQARLLRTQEKEVPTRSFFAGRTYARTRSLGSTTPSEDRVVKATVSSRILWKAKRLSEAFAAAVPPKSSDQAKAKATKASNVYRSQQVTRLFAQADVDGSGFLDRAEVHQVVVAMYGKYMIESELVEASAQLFQQLDADGNEAVPLSAFLKFFERPLDDHVGAVRLHLREFCQPIDDDFDPVLMFNTWVLCDKPLDKDISTEVLQLKWLRTVKNWKVAKKSWKEVIAPALQLQTDRWRLQEDDVALDFWNDSSHNAARFDDHVDVARDTAFEIDIMNDGLALCLADSNHTSSQVRVRVEVERLRLEARVDMPATETIQIHELEGEVLVKASYWNDHWSSSEAFLEPWALDVSVKGDDVSVNAQRHLVVDVTPSLLHALTTASSSLNVSSNPSSVAVPEKLYHEGHPVVAWIVNCTLGDVTVSGSGPVNTAGTLSIPRQQFGNPVPFVVDFRRRMSLRYQRGPWTLELSGGDGKRGGQKPWKLSVPISFAITYKRVFTLEKDRSLLVEVSVDARSQAPIITLRGITVVKNLTSAVLTVGDRQGFSMNAGPGETVQGWLGGALDINGEGELLLRTPPDGQFFKKKEKRLKSESKGYRFVLYQTLPNSRETQERTIICVPKLRLLNGLPGSLTCWAWNRIPGFYQEPEVLLKEPQTILERWRRLQLRSVDAGQQQSLDGVDPEDSILVAFEVARKRYMVVIAAGVANTKRTTLRARSSLRSKGIMSSFSGASVTLLSLDQDAPALDVDLEWENHGATLVVYSRYWVGNKTGRQLDASSSYMRMSENVTTAPVQGDTWADFATGSTGISARPQLALMHGFNEKIKLKISGGTTGSPWAWNGLREKGELVRWPESHDYGNLSQWSEAISVGVSNATGTVEMESINTEESANSVGFGLSMTVGVSIRDLPCPFERTKMITVAPRYVVMNNLRRDVQVWPTIGKLGRSRRAPGGVAVDGLPALKAGERLALDGLLHFDAKTKGKATEPLLSVSFPATEEDNPGGRSRWSNQISMQSVGDLVISVDSGLENQPPMAVCASVQLIGATIFVVLSEGQYPFCIENRSVVHTLVFSQEGASDYAPEFVVKPLEFKRFMFPDPDQPKRLLGRIQGATNRCVASYDLDNLAETNKEPLCMPSIYSRSRGVPEMTATFKAQGFARTLRLEDIPREATRALGTEGERTVQTEETPRGGLLTAQTSAPVMPRSLVPIGLHLSLTGLHVCVVDTKEKVPQELLALTVDYLRVSKPCYKREMEFTVHHAQLDDFNQSDRFIFGPVDSGLNSQRDANADTAGFEAKSWLKVSAEGPQDPRIAVFDPVHSVLSLKQAMMTLRPMELYVDVPRLVGIAERLATWVDKKSVATRHGATVLQTELVPGFRTPVQGQDMMCIVSLLNVAPCMISAEVKLRSRKGNDADDEEETLDSKVRRFMAGLSPPVRMFIGSFVQYGSSVAEMAPKFKFGELELRHICSAKSPLTASLAKHYSSQLLSQTVRVVGSVQMLGDPANLFEEIGGGFSKFLSKTGGRGAIGEGLKDLSGSIVGGACGSVAKISGALKDTVGSVSGVPLGDDQHPRDVSEGIDQALTSIANGVSDAVNGLVETPVVRAQEEGWMGFVGGATLGAVGVVTRPVEGFLGSIEKLAQGVEGQVSRDFSGYYGLRRPPRMAFSDTLAELKSEEHAPLPPMAQSFFWPMWKMFVRRVSFPALWWDRRVQGLVLSLAQVDEEGAPASEVFVVRGWDQDSWALQEDMTENSAVGRVGVLRGPFRLQITALLEPNVEMTKAVKDIVGFGQLPNEDLTESLLKTPDQDEDEGHVFQVVATRSSLLGEEFPVKEGQRIGRVVVCVMGQADKRVMPKNFTAAGAVAPGGGEDELTARTITSAVTS